MLYALFWLLFFWLPWSQEMTLDILTMVVAHSCEQEKKWKFWFFFENLKNLKNFQIFKKNQNFHFFLLFIYVLRPRWGYKKLFPDFKKAKKTSQNNGYKIFEMKVKNDKKLHFFDFFFQANSQNWHKRLQNVNFCYVTT